MIKFGVRDFYKIRDEILKFAKERGWGNDHNPKNLAESIMIETGELLEIFQWTDSKKSDEKAKREIVHLSEEIADVAIYLIELSERVGVDVLEAIEEKIEKNGKKYPMKNYDL